MNSKEAFNSIRYRTKTKVCEKICSLSINFFSPRLPVYSEVCDDAVDDVQLEVENKVYFSDVIALSFKTGFSKICV
jgi:hypothetical protein